MRRTVSQRIANSEDFTTHVNEITRRMAILDFLGLYEQARQDGIIGRIKYITQSTGFNDYNPTGWETYITRLLGRCLRYWLPYSTVIEKQRNRMSYQFHTSQIPEFRDIVTMQNVLSCRGNYHPHFRIYRAANNNAREYWRTRESINTEIVDELYRRHDRFRTGLETLPRVNLGNWPGASLNYGQPLHGHYNYGYAYRHRQTARTFGRYHSSEAYSEFKQLLEIIGSLYTTPEIFEMLNILAEYDVRDEQREENARHQAERRIRPGINVPPTTRQTVRDVPNDQLLAELRRRGLIPEGEEVTTDDPQPAEPNRLTTSLLERLRARGRIT